MANTIARCIGYDGARMKEEHRLGAEAAEGQANTWKTFTQCHIDKDGRGYLQVHRDGKRFSFTFGPETEELEVREA